MLERNVLMGSRSDGTAGMGVTYVGEDEQNDVGDEVDEGDEG